jgi:hypothetical protein
MEIVQDAGNSFESTKRPTPCNTTTTPRALFVAGSSANLDLSQRQHHAVTIGFRHHDASEVIVDVKRHDCDRVRQVALS